MKLVVGEKEGYIFAHEAILSKSSEFFQAAVKKEWLEEPYRVIKLPEDEIETIAAYIQWLNTGLVFSKTKGPIEDLPLAQHEQYANSMCLVRR